MKKIFAIAIILSFILLFENNVYAYFDYEVGDLIEYRDEYYFVIEDSDTSSNYIKLLKYEPLTKDEINEFSNGQFNNAEVYPTKPCEGNDYNLGNCDTKNYYSTDYNDSYIKLIIDNWIKSFEDDLYDDGNYKARILTNDELINNLGFKYVSDTYNIYSSTADTQTWVYSPKLSQNLQPYWILSDIGDKFLYVYGKNVYQNYSAWEYYIKPVIFLKKDANFSKKKYTMNHENKYRSFESQDLMSGISRNESYEIYSDSDENQTYIELLKEKPLTAQDIYKYSNGKYNTEQVPYYVSNTCNKNNKTGCTTDFNKSLVKEILDNWAEDIFGEGVVEVNGYKTRLLTIEELVDRFAYEPYLSSSITYRATADTNLYIYDFVRNYNTSFRRAWTMSPFEDSNYQVLTIGEVDYSHYPNYYKSAYIYKSAVYEDEDDIFNPSYASIRPILYVDKCYLGDYYCWNTDEIILQDDNDVTNDSGLVCKEGINYKTEKIYHYNKYKAGDVVEFNGEKYHVIEKSGTGKNYLTLLKDKELTIDELYKYGRDKNGNLFVNKYIFGTNDPEKVIYEFADGSGGMAYYTSETCTHELVWNGSSYNTVGEIYEGCKTNYQESDVKKVIDNWSKDKFKDNLIEVNGYKSRLLNESDLIDNLGFEYSAGSTYLHINGSENSDWIFGNKNYWTMMEYNNDYGKSILRVDVSRQLLATSVINTIYAVRPVVNIDKCAIEGGCEIEEIQVEDGCKEDANSENKNNNSLVSEEETQVNNPSTLDNILLYVIGLGFTLIYLILSNIYFRKYNKK